MYYGSPLVIIIIFSHILMNFSFQLYNGKGGVGEEICLQIFLVIYMFNIQARKFLPKKLGCNYLLVLISHKYGG